MKYQNLRKQSPQAQLSGSIKQWIKKLHCITKKNITLDSLPKIEGVLDFWDTCQNFCSKPGVWLNNGRISYEQVKTS